MDPSWFAGTGMAIAKDLKVRSINSKVRDLWLYLSELVGRTSHHPGDAVLFRFAPETDY